MWIVNYVSVFSLFIYMCFFFSSITFIDVFIVNKFNAHIVNDDLPTKFQEPTTLPVKNSRIIKRLIRIVGTETSCLLACRSLDKQIQTKTGSDNRGGSCK